MDHRGIDAALRDAHDTRRVVIGAGALGSVEAAFVACFGRQPAVVVADETTFAVAGEAVLACLSPAGCQIEEPIVFPDTPLLYADFENVRRLEGALGRRSAVPVAVGSGTINDLTKLASHRVGRPYMCVATAASVDGYAAFGASITRDGFKQTMACPAPRAVLADLEVLAHAPPAMNAAGYGDLLGKVTAGADWMLADALAAEPIDPRAWPLVQHSLRAWTAHPDRLPAGDHQAIGHLFEGLTMAGLAMQISQSSRPASGSEHQLSHLWEMQALGHGEPPIPHGFKVGIGTIAVAALYERVLARDLSDLDVDALCRAWPSRLEVERAVRRAHDIPQLAENAVAESLAKYVGADQLRRRLLVVRERWPAIRERLGAQLMTADHLRELLRAAGCPTHPDEIGVSLTRLRESYTLARTIRSRYTVLDLVDETGILSPCVDELFAPGGFWSRAAVSPGHGGEVATRARDDERVG
ncbi:MAG: sn-glycerol-1-phosphate dehydrogenase [Chloroflexi bacterium]|nr:sn-glycerol-1-phosphate dehydrogenase [Chloroflexota bacterium]